MAKQAIEIIEQAKTTIKRQRIIIIALCIMLTILSALSVNNGIAEYRHNNTHYHACEEHDRE